MARAVVTREPEVGETVRVRCRPHRVRAGVLLAPRILDANEHFVPATDPPEKRWNGCAADLPPGRQPIESSDESRASSGERDRA